MKSWYSIKAQADGEYEVLIYDEIGYWGISAKQFIDDFKKIPAEAKVALRINSPGGDVFDSLAIHNVIKRHAGEVNGTVDGIAASGASIIAMAAKRLEMPENSFLMIHNSSGLAVGNADDMRELADVLDKIDTALVSTYVTRTGQSEKKIQQMLADETWLTAKEAVDLGFADEVTNAVKIAASANLDRFKNLPQPLKALSPAAHAPAAPSTESSSSGAASDKTAPQSTDNRIEIVDLSAEQIREEAAEIVALCNQHELPEMAAEFLAKSARLADVQKRFANATEIKNRCVAAGMPELAKKFIAADMTPDEVADNLLKRKQLADPAEIDNKQRDEGGQGGTQPQAKPFDVLAIMKRYVDREKKYYARQ